MLMHYHALFLSPLSFLSIVSYYAFYLLSSLASGHGTQEIRSFEEPDILSWFFIFIFSSC